MLMEDVMKDGQKMVYLTLDVMMDGQKMGDQLTVCRYCYVDALPYLYSDLF
jgi:hypothetical protein